MILHERARETKFAEVALLAGLIAPGASEQRDTLLRIYRQELFEDAYRPAVIRQRREAARATTRVKLDQQAMLAKAAKLDAPAEPAPKKGAKKPSKR